MKIKRFLNEVLQSVLKPIRERREYWEAGSRKWWTS